MPFNPRPRPFALTQYIRIFAIVHLTSFLITRAALESYRYTGPARPTPPIRTKSSQYSQPAERSAAADTAMPKPKTENTKKVAGNARKAEAAAQKQAAADAADKRAEDDKWSKGAKSGAKKAAVEDKKASAAAAKAERDRLLAEEEPSQPSKPKGAGKKVAEKKTRGTLDLSQLDGDDDNKREKTLNASGIDNALDALSLTGDSKGMKMDRHPERRFPAAYKAYEEKRLPQVKEENPGLRRNQQVELIRKEFEKHPDNPFNQETNVRFDATKEEIADAKTKVKAGVESRLAEK